MRRFVLIDQSITGEGGHYLTYARAVLDGAYKEGFLPMLCVNRRFCMADMPPYRLYPAFTYTSLESLSSFRLHRIAAQKERRRYLWGGIIKPTAQRAARIVFGAHYPKVRKRFFPPSKSAPDGDEEQSYKAACFAHDLRELLPALRLSKEDIVFFPTLSIVELYGLEQALRSLTDQQFPTVHLLFRWNPFHGRREDYERELSALQYTQKSFQICEDLCAQHMISFYTDSQRLMEQYNLFSQCRFSVLPIPHTGYSMCTDKREKTVISYLGDARPEKGFLHLPEIVDALSNENVWFQIQAYFNIPGGEGGIAACRRRLRRRKNLTLYERPLDVNEYASVLAQTDIMLILYDPKQYYARSSGIFAEAMAAGIPTIVPADTWMSEQVCKGRYALFQRVVEQFAIRRTELHIHNCALLWNRDADAAEQSILCLEVDWGSGGDSIRVETITLREPGGNSEKEVNFMERGRDHRAMLMVSATKNCRAIRFCFSGTYGQKLPNIKKAEIVELSSCAPMLGEIGDIYDDRTQCKTLLRKMIHHYSVLRDSSEAFARDWMAFHNPKSLIKKLQ